jgi:tetratricopeptide (TPR) repeat protein
MVLAAITLAVYAPLRHHDVVNLDDDLYVANNPWVREGVSWDAIAWALGARHAANWHPVTWISHMLDFELMGPAPGAHHLVSLALHVTSTMVLLLLLERITGCLWRSVFVAAMFGLHPLHVESVAWLAERKDVLSTLFWLLATCAYVAYSRRSSLGWYLGALCLFALGLMSKPMLVTLPFTLLLLDYWPLGRFAPGSAATVSESARTAMRLVGEKIPFLLLSMTSSAITFVAQQQGGAVAPLDRLSFGTRVANATVSYVIYLRQTVWPEGLSVFYPYREDVAGWQVAAAGLVLAAATGLSLFLARRCPPVTVGWLWYLGTLLPVIGLVQVGNQAHADRYTYVPLIGIFIIAAWGAPTLVGRWTRRRAALTAVGAAVVLASAVMARSQLATWKNSESLYRHALAVTRNNSLAHYNLALFLSQERRPEEAIAHYEDALRIKPTLKDARYNLANVYYRAGKIAEAARHYAEVLRLDPLDPGAYNGLANARALEGRLDEALQLYTEALRIRPDYAEAHSNLAVLLARLGRTEEAAAHYAEALRIRPDYARAREGLQRLRQGGTIPTP